MPYPVLALDAFHEVLLADHRNRFGDPNLQPQSDNWIRTRILAAAVTDCHSHIRSVQRDTMPDTATLTELDRWLAIAGLTRRGATAATGAAILRVTGSAGSSVAGTETLTAPSGITYTPGTGTIPGGGSFIDVGLTANTPGSDGLLNEDDTVQFNTPPAGIDETATILFNMVDGGEDVESDGEARVRLLQRLAQAAAGGNNQDYKDFVIEANDDAKTQYVYPNRNGLGSVDVAALKAGQGTVRLLDGAERAALLTAIEPSVPVNLNSADATIRILEVTDTVQDVDTLLVPESGQENEFDWNDAVPPIVLTYDSGTRLLTFTLARPTTMQAGHRISFDTATGDGAEAVIESLSGSDAVVLVNSPSVVPVATDAAYSGGPLVQPARANILALLNSLGPTVGDFGFGDWTGALFLSQLFEKIQTTSGVLDSTLVLPATTIVLADTQFPTNTTVPLIIPQLVLVRKDNT